MLATIILAIITATSQHNDAGDWQDHQAPESVCRTIDKLELGLPTTRQERKELVGYLDHIDAK